MCVYLPSFLIKTGVMQSSQSIHECATCQISGWFTLRQSSGSSVTMYFTQKWVIQLKTLSHVKESCHLIRICINVRTLNDNVCHVQMSHVTYKWRLFHILRLHVTLYIYIWIYIYSCGRWMTMCVTYKWVMLHINQDTFTCHFSFCIHI